VADSLLSLLRFDQLERQAVEIFDQNRARVAKRVRSLNDRNVGRLEMCDDRIEIRVGEADVVDHLPARAADRCPDRSGRPGIDADTITSRRWRCARCRQEYAAGPGAYTSDT
jgi:hypothetical protein